MKCFPKYVKYNFFYAEFEFEISFLKFGLNHPLRVTECQKYFFNKKMKWDFMSSERRRKRFCQK